MSAEVTLITFISKWWAVVLGWVVGITYTAGKALQRVNHLEKRTDEDRQSIKDALKDFDEKLERERDRQEARDRIMTDKIDSQNRTINSFLKELIKQNKG